MTGPPSQDWSQTTEDLIRAWDPLGGSDRWKAGSSEKDRRGEGKAEAEPDTSSEPTWRLNPEGPCEVEESFPPLALNLGLPKELASVTSESVNFGLSTAEFRAKATRRPTPPYPKPGTTLAGFRLVSELGRGTFARVYLAEQVDLAGRPVALKVSKALGDEPESLARLQHAHIMPIYSVHDDPATGLRLMCMPYFGGANLAQVLEMTGDSLPAENTGNDLVEALDQVRARHPLPTGPTKSWPSTASTAGMPSPQAEPTQNRPRQPSRPRWGRYLAKLADQAQLLTRQKTRALAESPTQEVTALSSEDSNRPRQHRQPENQPTRRFLQSRSYIQAAAWIVARLAGALGHAHDRGILHRDLKPSNILITADGNPMLLDFNLSTDLIGPDKVPRALLGGTLPYMSPEHLDAIDAQGSTQPEAVDHRSDLYSLALILFEMVVGRHPFPSPDSSRPLPEVIREMIAERWQSRPSARAMNPSVPRSLDAILKKCLDPNPSGRYQHAEDLAEDLQRFLDNQPLAHASDPSYKERIAQWFRQYPKVRTGTAAAALLIGLGSLAWTLADRFADNSATLRFQRFEATYRTCQSLLTTRVGPINQQLERGLGLAERELASLVSGGPLGFLKSGQFRRLRPADRRAFRERVSELILLRERIRAFRANQLREPERRAALEKALTWVNLAKQIDPSPPAALFQQRAALKFALGRTEEARRDEQRAQATRPLTARGEYLLGVIRAAEGKLEAAEAHLERAIALDSQQFWAWFVLGLCRYDQGRFLEAAADFSICAMLEPDFAWPHLNRGLALAQSGRLLAARATYDRALEIDPGFVEARVSRALCALELDDPASALRDLNHVLKLASSPELIQFAKDPDVLAARTESLARLGHLEEVD